MPAAPQRPTREHPRVAAGFPVSVEADGLCVAARARDLSMAGLYVDGPLPVPRFVRLHIPLPGVPRAVHPTCEVERRDRHGVALSFSSIDWEDLLLVARYLSPRL